MVSWSCYSVSGVTGCAISVPFGAIVGGEHDLFAELSKFVNEHIGATDYRVV